jgi:nicotinamide-nucleotide amidase
MPFDSKILKETMEGRQLTLAVAESLTSGRIQAAAGAVSGASHYFLGGVTVYSIDQKVKHLGIDRAHADSVNAVSPRVAAEMATGVATLFESDFSVSSTGYAEPSPEKNVLEPFAFVAVCRRTNGVAVVLSVDRITGTGLTRTEMQQHVAEFALGRLQEHLDLERE